MRSGKFLGGLLIILCTAALIPVVSRVKGIRSFNSIESFIGKPFSEIEDIMIKENLKRFGEPLRDGELESYSFYEGSTENYGSEMIFIVNSGKVVACAVVYAYEDGNNSNTKDSDQGGLSADLFLLKKSIRDAGYEVIEEKESYFQYKKNENDCTAVIETDEELQMFGLYFGKTEVLQTLKVIHRKEQIVVSENFSTNANNWFTGENHEYSIKVIGGAYQIQSKQGGNWYATKSFLFDPNKNFEISADIKKISGPDDALFGMILGFDIDADRYFLSGITGNHDYVYADNGKTSRDLVYNPNPAVHAGNSTNHMRLVKSGSKMSCYVNGTFLGETDFDGFYGTYFGFRIWSGDQPMIIQFDNFEIKTFE